jgi:hypothetical protein
MGPADYLRRALQLAHDAGPGVVHACGKIVADARQGAQLAREAASALDLIAEGATKLAGVARGAPPGRENEAIHVRPIDVEVIEPERPVAPGGTRYRIAR